VKINRTLLFCEDKDSPMHKRRDKSLTKGQRIVLTVFVLLAIVGIVWWQYLRLGGVLEHVPVH